MADESAEARRKRLIEEFARLSGKPLPPPPPAEPPTPAPLSPQDAAALEQLRAATAGVKTSGDRGYSQQEQKLPDPDARQRMEEALVARAEELGGRNPSSTQEALAAVPAGLGPPPESIPAGPSWSEQLSRTFGVQVARDDGRPLSPVDRLRAILAGNLDTSLDLLPYRGLEALQPLQDATRKYQGVTGEGLVGGTAAEVRSGVARAIDAFVPDGTTGEALFGVKTKGLRDTVTEIGQGVEGIGARLAKEGADNTEKGDEYGPFLGTGGLAIQGAGKLLQGPDAARNRISEVWLPPPTVRTETPGLRVESPALAFLRVAGSGTGIAAELVKRTPTVPKVVADKLGIRKDIRPPLDPEAGALAELTYLLEPVTLGDVAGAPAGMLQQVRRDKPANWFDQLVPATARNAFQAVLERVEKGQGLEEEGSAIATTYLGPEYARMGYGAGILADILATPEAALSGAGAKVVGIADRFAAAGEFSKASKMQRLWAAMTSSAVDMGETAGGAFVRSFEDGKVGLDALPPNIRPHLDDILREQNMTPEELAALEGTGPAPSVMSESGQNRLKDPRVQAALEPDLTPLDKRLREKLEPNDQAPGNLYVVRNALEDETPGGVVKDLEGALKVMAGRRIRGDMPWRSGQLPLAAWVEDPVPVPKGKLAGPTLAPEGSAGPTLVPGGSADTIVPASSAGKTLVPTPSASQTIVPLADDVPLARTYSLRRLKGADGNDAAVIDRVIAQNPSMRNQKLRDLFEPEQREMGAALFEAQTGMKAAPPRTRLGQAIQDAYRRRSVDLTGASELTYLPNGSLATFADKGRIMRGVERDLDAAGLGGGGGKTGKRGKKDQAPDVQWMLGQRQLTPEQTGKLDALAKRWGLDGFNPTPQGLRDLRVAGSEYHGGVLAQAKSRVRGVPGFFDRIQETLGMLHTGRRVWTGLPDAARRMGATYFTEAMLADPLAALPVRTKAAMTKGSARLERAADELLGELEEGIRIARKNNGVGIWSPLTEGQMAEVYAKFVDDIRPATIEEMGAVKKVKENDPNFDYIAWRDEYALKLQPWVVDEVRPELLRAAALEWAEKLAREARDTARSFLESSMAAAGVDVLAESRKWQNNLLDSTLDSLYEEVFFEGLTAGGTLHRLMGEAGVKEFSGAQGMLTFLVHQRRLRIMDEVFEELLDAGAIVKNDEMFVRSAQGTTDSNHILRKVLNGQDRTVNPDGSVTHHYPPGATAWAASTLHGMGLEPGATTRGLRESIVEVKLSEHRKFQVPAYLEERLVQSLTGGAFTGADRSLTGALLPTSLNAIEKTRLAAATGMRLWKTHSVAGIIPPRPSAALAQSLGQFMTLWTTRGLTEALRTLPAITAAGVPFIQKPGMVGEMMLRLSHPDVPRHAPPTPLAQVLRDSNGVLHDIDDLTRAARDNGLADTIVSFEAGKQLERLLFREMTPVGRLLWGPSAWQSMVMDYMGGFDQAARISTFLREVERGVPPALAAKEAKRASMDFRDLTKFEAVLLRNIFTFYAYQRKSADTLLWAAVRHPERVAQQIRLAHHLWADRQTPIQQGTSQNPESDLARIWLDLGGEQSISPSGAIDRNYTWSPTTPPVLIPEAFRNLRMFLQTPAVAYEDWMDATNPVINAMKIALVGEVAPYSDKASVLPPVLMMTEAQATLYIHLFDVASVSAEKLGLDPKDADPSATAAHPRAIPSVWVAGSGPTSLANEGVQRKNRMLWKQFQALLSSGPANTEGALRAVGAMEPRFDRTWSEEAMWFTGASWRKRPTSSKARNDQLLEQERARERVKGGAKGVTAE